MSLKQDNTSIIFTSIYSLLKKDKEKKNQAVVIYLPTNVISDFISLILNELKPPLPCARLSNFIAN